MDYLNEDNINGTKINYYFICKTKLWFFSHNIQMEQNSKDVHQGKLLHENSYKREKEYLIDNKISIDYIKFKNKVEVHEIKKSKKMKKAHEYQLLYYMYYLKYKKDIENIIGYLNYPLLRSTNKIELTKENKLELDKIILDINNLIKQDVPNKPIKKKICKNCAYHDLCYI